MRIISLNVNGLRAFDAKNDGNFNSFCLNVLKGDIICLQETKGSPGSLAKYHSLKDYRTFSSYFTKGRHGVSTLVKKNLFCGKNEEIMPGRILKTHHGNFVLYNCYMPYYDENKEGDKTEIIKIYDILMNSVIDIKRAVICGDLNATYNVLDHYQFYNELSTLIELNEWKKHSDISNSKNLIKYERELKINSDKLNSKMAQKLHAFQSLIKAEEEFLDYSIFQDKVAKVGPKQTELPFHFFTFNSLEEYFFEVYQREWMCRLVKQFVDTFRLFNHKTEQFTCWNTLFNLRPVNWGTRIDYVLCTRDIECVNSEIMPSVFGSDHCPVFTDFSIEDYHDDRNNIVTGKNNLLDFFSKRPDA